MSFIDKIDELEKINISDKRRSEKELEYKTVLSDLSKVVIDDTVINDYFAYITSEYLTAIEHSDFNRVITDNEEQFISDRIELVVRYGSRNGNSLTFRYPEGHKDITLKKKRNNVYLASFDTSKEDEKKIDLKKFVKDDESYYMKSFGEMKIKYLQEDLRIETGEKFTLDKNDNVLNRHTFSKAIKAGSIISETKIDDKKEYVVEDGIVYVVKDTKSRKLLLDIINATSDSFKSF